MSFTLVLPGLLAHADELALNADLAHIATHATAIQVERDGIESAILTALGIHGAGPAPLAAAGAELAVDDDFVLYADPVMFALHDGVVLSKRVDDVSELETSAILTRLNAHFRSDALTFHAPRPDAWFARLPSAPAATMTPLPAARNRPLLAQLPQGPQGRQWQRWQDEIQMLLHDRSMTASPHETERSDVNGIWFWGAGRWSAVSLQRIDAATASNRAGDVARGAALRSGGETRMLSADSPPPARDALVVVAPEATSSPQPALGNFLAPALAALRSGRFEELVLVTDGHGAAVTWRARSPSLVSRAIATLRRPRFSVPGTE